MADIYVPADVPLEYDQQFFAEELRRISGQLQVMELPYLLLVPQHVEPVKLYEGMVANADGSDWNPGHGGGLYTYTVGVWIPMFATNQGIKVDNTQVANTTTETEIYSEVLAADSLHEHNYSTLILAGYYSTGAASDSWTLRIKFNGSTVYTITRQSANNATDFGWKLSVEGVIRTDGASGTMIMVSELSDDDTSKLIADSTVQSIDTTVANTISVTVQWVLAKVNNVFDCDQGVITHFH